MDKGLEGNVITYYTKALITEITGVTCIHLDSEMDKSKLRTTMQATLKRFKAEIAPTQKQGKKHANPFGLLSKTLAAKCLSA